MSIDQIPAETESDQERPESRRVFDRIYAQLAEKAPGATPERRAELFMEEVADGARRHVRSMQTQGLTPERASAGLLARMKEHIGHAYAGDAALKGKYKEAAVVYGLLMGRVEELVKSRQVEPAVAAVFIQLLPDLAAIGDYNAITRSAEPFDPAVLRQKNAEYAPAADQLWQRYPVESRFEQDGQFYHFNSRLEGPTRSRVYVSFDGVKDPARALAHWEAALDETGLRNRVYFKIATGANTRFDTIVVYQRKDNDGSDLERLLTAFTKRCPQELLAPAMPTAVELRHGIALAAEPANVNRVIELTGSHAGKISYSQLIAALTELGFEFAYDRQNRDTQARTPPTPKSLKESAAAYFDQFLKLAGINPDTMVTNAQGGRLPDWAQRLRSQT